MKNKFNSKDKKKPFQTIALITNEKGKKCLKDNEQKGAITHNSKPKDKEKMEKIPQIMLGIRTCRTAKPDTNKNFQYDVLLNKLLKYLKKNLDTPQYSNMRVFLKSEMNNKNNNESISSILLPSNRSKDGKKQQNNKEQIKDEIKYKMGLKINTPDSFPIYYKENKIKDEVELAKDKENKIENTKNNFQKIKQKQNKNQTYSLENKIENRSEETNNKNNNNNEIVDSNIFKNSKYSKNSKNSKKNFKNKKLENKKENNLRHRKIHSLYTITKGSTLNDIKNKIKSDSIMKSKDTKNNESHISQIQKPIIPIEGNNKSKETKNNTNNSLKIMKINDLKSLSKSSNKNNKLKLNNLNIPTNNHYENCDTHDANWFLNQKLLSKVHLESYGNVEISSNNQRKSTNKNNNKEKNRNSSHKLSKYLASENIKSFNKNTKFKQNKSHRINTNNSNSHFNQSKNINNTVSNSQNKKLKHSNNYKLENKIDDNKEITHTFNTTNRQSHNELLKDKNKISNSEKVKEIKLNDFKIDNMNYSYRTKTNISSSNRESSGFQNFNLNFKRNSPGSGISSTNKTERKSSRDNKNSKEITSKNSLIKSSNNKENKINKLEYPNSHINPKKFLMKKQNTQGKLIKPPILNQENILGDKTKRSGRDSKDSKKINISEIKKEAKLSSNKNKNKSKKKKKKKRHSNITLPIDSNLQNYLKLDEDKSGEFNCSLSQNNLNNFSNSKNRVMNEEMMKEIKSVLDDNLKVMLNFSYENFLSKDSETESKGSSNNGGNICNEIDK